ncbi:hypothetical protein V6N13_111506 [Hibiscus sabdariffa]
MKASQALSTMAKVVRFFREDNKEIGGFFAQATEEGNQHEKEFVTKEAKLQMPNTKVETVDEEMANLKQKCVKT